MLTLTWRQVVGRVLESCDSTERTGEATPPERRKGLVLRGVLPGDRTAIQLDKSRIILGRDAECDAVLAVERVSRRHAEIYRQGPLVALRDLESTNGTWVDGQRTPHGAVRPGMLIRIGYWLGLVEQDDSSGGREGFAELAPGLFGGDALRVPLESVFRVASTVLPVVLVGESGSGKEGFARALHRASGRRGPFHAVNCAALPLALAEGELFGFERGAFTGAERANLGHLRAAHGGTLFLDEVVELPLALQAKLLRAVQEQEVTPLGQTRAVKFDARIVVACQLPLETYVGEQRFRFDLAQRLTGLTITIPSLRERRADIPSLFTTLLDRLTGGRAPTLDVRLFERLCLHSWPGNVRELEFLARQMLALHGLERRWGAEHLPQALRGELSDSVAPPAVGQDRNDYDRARFEAALRQHGNFSQAAASVGISRQRAYRLKGTVKETRGSGEKPGAKG